MGLYGRPPLALAGFLVVVGRCVVYTFSKLKDRRIPCHNEWSSETLSRSNVFTSAV